MGKDPSRRLTRDRHLDAALELILSGFRHDQEQRKLNQESVASTFVGLVGQLECSSQLTAKQQALCREIYVLVVRSEEKNITPSLPPAIPDADFDRPVRPLRVRLLSEEPFS